MTTPKKKKKKKKRAWKGVSGSRTEGGRRRLEALFSGWPERCPEKSSSGGGLSGLEPGC